MTEASGPGSDRGAISEPGWTRGPEQIRPTRRMKVQLERPIGLRTAVALYTGAVLGTGILVLPAVAAETAGPASIVAWAVLCLLSLPLALTFAALARREPVAGGFSVYIERAFGRRWGAMAG